jgi:hypothetical protein
MCNSDATTTKPPYLGDTVVMMEDVRAALHTFAKVAIYPERANVRVKLFKIFVLSGCLIYRNAILTKMFPTITYLFYLLI